MCRRASGLVQARCQQEMGRLLDRELVEEAGREGLDGKLGRGSERIGGEIGEGKLKGKLMEGSAELEREVELEEDVQMWGSVGGAREVAAQGRRHEGGGSARAAASAPQGRQWQRWYPHGRGKECRRSWRQ